MRKKRGKKKKRKRKKEKKNYDILSKGVHLGAGLVCLHSLGPLKGQYEGLPKVSSWANSGIRPFMPWDFPPFWS